MRRRILQSTLAVAVVAVLLLGVPLAVAAVVVARQDAQRAADSVAESVGRMVGDRLESGQPLTPATLRPPRGYYVEVRLADGSAVSAGERAEDPAVVGSYDAGTHTVLAQRPRSAGAARMVRVAVVVVLVALLALAAAVALGLRQARRLTEPLVDLAHRAHRLGSGDARPQFARYGVEEVDRVAAVLEHSAERVAAMLASERQFASDASHQLRTPLTALSMRLEEICNAEDPRLVREEARIALGQVERLAATVEHLLAITRQTRTAAVEAVELDEVLRQQVAEWRPAFDAARRRVRVSGVRGLRGAATPGGLAQVVATLLENTLVHGAGTVRVHTRIAGGSVVVEVGDEGAGVPPELGSRIFERAVSGRSSTGLGLALARDLVAADGGRLELVAQRPAVFAIFLAATPDPTAAPPRPPDAAVPTMPAVPAGSVRRS